MNAFDACPVCNDFDIDGNPLPLRWNDDRSYIAYQSGQESRCRACGRIMSAGEGSFEENYEFEPTAVAAYDLAPAPAATTEDDDEIPF